MMAVRLLVIERIYAFATRLFVIQRIYAFATRAPLRHVTRKLRARRSPRARAAMAPMAARRAGGKA